MTIFKVACDCEWQFAAQRNWLLCAIVQYKGVAINLAIYSEARADRELGNGGLESAKLICDRRHWRAVAVREVIQVARKPYLNAGLRLTVHDECAFNHARRRMTAEKD